MVQMSFIKSIHFTWRQILHFLGVFSKQKLEFSASSFEMGCKWSCIIVFTMIAFGFSMAHSWNPGDTVIVLNDKYNPPYSFLDAQGKPHGITIDLWNLWSRKTKVPVKFRLLQWDSCFYEIRQGRAHAIAAAMKTPDRVKEFAFSKQLLTIVPMVFFHKHMEGVGSISDLKGYQIGVVKGDANQVFAQQMQDSLNFVEYANTEALVQAAIDGKIHIFIADRQLGVHFLAKHKEGENFHYAGMGMPSQNHYAMVLLKEVELSQVVIKGFQEIGSLEIRQILNEWKGNGVQYSIPWKLVAGSLAIVSLLGFLALLWNAYLQKKYMSVSKNLQDTEHRFRKMFFYAPIPIVLCQRDGKVVELNAQFTQLLGYTLQDIPTIEDWWQKAYPDEEYRESLKKRWQNGLAEEEKRGGVLLPKEFKVRAADGRFLRMQIGVTLDSYIMMITLNDVTPLKEMENSLREADLRYRLAVKASYDVIWDIDVLQKTLDVNKRWNEMLRQGDKPLPTRLDEWFENVVDEDRSALETRIENVIRGIEPERLEHVFRVYGYMQKVQWLQMRGSVVDRDSAGVPTRIAGTITDITSRVLAELRRDELIEQLKYRNQELERFNYAVSHDLRNPLVSIAGFAHEALICLEEGSLEYAKESLQHIDSASKRMSDLVNALLTYARSGRELGALQKVNLNALLLDVTESLHTLIHETNTEIQVQDLAEFECDPTRLRQVFQNLLENAIKFSLPKKPPQIMIWREKNRIYFKDNGIGISSEYTEKVFTLFEKLNVEKPGMGLGLTLSRRIMELHNGSLRILQSNPQQGTTFLLEFSNNS